MLLSEPAAPLDDAFLVGWIGHWHGPAPAANLPPPEVTVVRDHIENGQRKLTLRLESQRDAPTLGLWIDGDSATVRSATVAGRAVPTIGPWASGPSVFGSSEHQRMASRFSWNSTSAPTTSCFASRTAPMMSVPCQVSHHRQTVACS